MEILRKIKNIKANSNGFSLPEAMISSVLLLMVVNQSASLYNTSVKSLNGAQLRDGVDAAVFADLEAVRQEVFEWAQDSNTVDGQLSYSPPVDDCKNKSLATTLVSELSIELQPAGSTVDLTYINTPISNLTVTRTINVDSENGNLINIQYQSSGNSNLTVNKATTLLPPAQGWCP